MSLNIYNNLLTSGRWYNKDPNNARILSLLGVAQKLADYSKNLSEKSNTSNRWSTRREPAYIKYLPTWILEGPKGVVGNKTKDVK